MTLSNNDDIKYWLGVGGFIKFGSKRLLTLLNNFQDIKSIYQASLTELKQVGIDEKIAQEFLLYKEKTNLDKLLDVTNKNKIKILTINDFDYPHNLKQIKNPPVILYYKGELPDNNQYENYVAIVGTRKITHYGEKVTIEIVNHLAKNKVVIVSGLAIGVDTLAHKIALENNDKTIAVLGSGLDNIFPPQNRQLAQDIVDTRNTLISEYPLGTAALHYHFPYRNRIISGLSNVTIITEADENSGALITAEYAIAQGRTVYVVPGNIYSPMSSGCNKLIKQGAKIITSVENILYTCQNKSKSINFQQTKNQKSVKNPIKRILKTKIIPTANADEERVLKHLTTEPIHIDELVRNCNLKVQEVNSILSVMELKGMVKNIGGMNWVIE